MKLISAIGLLMLLSSLAFAEDKGRIGLTLKIKFEGFFSPVILSADVEKVESGSVAEKSGIRVGDKVIKIEGCEIPGCPGDYAKELIEKRKGQLLSLVLQHADGSEYAVSLPVK